MRSVFVCAIVAFMKLREQVLDIARRRINPPFARTAGFPHVVVALVELAFRERWDEQAVEARLRLSKGYFLTDSVAQRLKDTDVLHRAVELMHHLGFITEEHPGC